MPPVMAGHGQALAVNEHDLEPIADQPQQKSAAANAERPDRSLHRHRALDLADLAADVAEDAARRVECLLAGIGMRVVDEFVDGQVRIRPDAHRRFVEEEDLRLTFGLGIDPLPKDDVLADHQLAPRGVRRRAGAGLVDGAADADPVVRRCGPVQRERHRQNQGREKRELIAEPRNLCLPARWLSLGARLLSDLPGP